MTLAEKLAECQEVLLKYEAKGDGLSSNRSSHVLGIVFGKLNDIQLSMAAEVNELKENIEKNVLKPLADYQKEVQSVRDARKDLKEAYDKIETNRASLEKARREAESAQRVAGGSTSTGSHGLNRMTSMIPSESNKRHNDVFRLEDKVK